jgi:hypothetical protein
VTTSYQSQPEQTSQNYIPKLVRETAEGRAKIDAAITTLMIWALVHGEPWSTPGLDSEVA